MKKQVLIYLLIITTCIVKAGAFYAGVPRYTYLHTDRNCYVSGDFLFLKGYHIVSGTSGFRENALYVDIINNENVFVAGEMLLLNNGLANGIINIPDSIKTGEYVVRLYTNYSRDLEGNNILFSKKIYVTNRFGKNGTLLTDTSDKKVLDSAFIQNYGDIHASNIRVSIADSVFLSRAKVKLNIENLEKTSFKGSISVKAVSPYEQFYTQQNGNVLDAEKVVSQVSSEDIPVQIENENKGVFFTGKVDFVEPELLNPKLIVLIAFEDSLLNLKYSKVDLNGEFCFLMENFIDNQVAYISVYEYPKMTHYENANISIHPKFLQVDATELTDLSKGFEISRDSLNLQKALIAKAYGVSFFEADSLEPIVITFESKYLSGSFNYSIKSKDYVDLPDFIQIAKEILPPLKLKEKKGKKSFVVFDGVNNLVRKNPIFFIDGVPLTDLENLFSLGTDRIESIDIQTEARYYGDVPFENGMVFIWTNDMDFWEKEQVKHTFIYELDGFQKEVRFNFPDYSEKSSVITPDFRQTLYWEPMLNIAKGGQQELSFFTSDEKGQFEIIIEGVSSENEKILIRKLIKVE